MPRGSGKLTLPIRPTKDESNFKFTHQLILFPIPARSPDLVPEVKRGVHEFDEHEGLTVRVVDGQRAMVDWHFEGRS